MSVSLLQEIVSIRLRKEVTYGKKTVGKQELKNNVRERVYYIYNPTKIQQTVEASFRV